MEESPTKWPLFLREDIVIDELTLCHAEATYRWVSDCDVADNIGLRHEPSLAATKAWIESRCADSSSEPFAVLLGGRHVGNVVLDQIDRYIGSSRMSIYIGEPDARKQGVARTATWLALHRAFGVLGLRKVWLTVHAQNHRALQLYLGIGFVIEGVHRDEFLLRGHRVPLFYMGMLRSDFVVGRSS